MAWAAAVFAEEIEHHLAGADRGQRIDHALPGVFRRAAADGLEHARALRIDVAAGGDAHAALHHRAEVGDDVAEHVVGDDHVEPFGILDEPHRRGVHVGVIAFDGREILLADFVEGAFPEIEGVGQHVGLAAERQLGCLAGRGVLRLQSAPGFAAAAFLGQFERETQATLHAAPGIDAFLDGDFVGRALENKSARTGVKTFVVPPAQPARSALPQTIATHAKRVAFFLRKLTEVNMFILSSARGAGMFERIFR